MNVLKYLFTLVAILSVSSIAFASPKTGVYVGISTGADIGNISTTIASPVFSSPPDTNTVYNLSPVLGFDQKINSMLSLGIEIAPVLLGGAWVTGLAGLSYVPIMGTIKVYPLDSSNISNLNFFAKAGIAYIYSDGAILFADSIENINNVWQGIFATGVGYDLSSHTSISLQYQYLVINNLQYKIVDYGWPSTMTENAVSNGSVQSVLIGITYKF